MKLNEKDSKMEELSNTISQIHLHQSDLTQQPQEESKQLQPQLPLKRYKNTYNFTEYTHFVYSICMSADTRWIISEARIIM
jgi:hypothetical protein